VLTRTRVETPRVWRDERRNRRRTLSRRGRTGEKGGERRSEEDDGEGWRGKRRVGKGNRGARVVPREYSRPLRLCALVHLALLLSSVSRRVLGKLIPIKASRYATAVGSRRDPGNRGEGGAGTEFIVSVVREVREKDGGEVIRRMRDPSAAAEAETRLWPMRGLEMGPAIN
jgi:hypothetical protein